MICLVYYLFQSTHPRRVRRSKLPEANTIHYFNPRTREGCDRKDLKAILEVKFQSTHPRRVRLSGNNLAHCKLIFQSTHPRRVRHYIGFDYYARLLISIHAPAKGATERTTSKLKTGAFQSTHPRRVRQGGARFGRFFYCISIHAPAKGATRNDSRVVKPLSNFNPRTREGCDHVESAII